MTKQQRRYFWLVALVLSTGLVGGIGCGDDAREDVGEPPRIEAPEQVECVVFDECELEIFLAGEPAPEVRVDPGLPEGLELNAEEGRIQGRPASASVGYTELELTASNGVAPDAVAAVTLRVEPPARPQGLERYMTGDEDDARVSPNGPAVILMGGGVDVDQAFQWWQTYVAGGDVVVLRTSGSDGYNDYLYREMGGVNSVETLIVDDREWADNPYVEHRVERAEGIFLAGGNQATYMEYWKGSALAEAIDAAYQRGAVVGGTSAGLAVLGEFVFAAYHDTVYSDEALDDPYNHYMTLDEAMVSLPLLTGVITDSHFRQRDRLGRLMGFVARVIEDGWSDQVLGVGVDERTALVIDPDGGAEVLGQGAVYLVEGGEGAARCEPGQTLEYETQYRILGAGDTVEFPGGHSPVDGQGIEATNGELIPAMPYRDE